MSGFLFSWPWSHGGADSRENAGPAGSSNLANRPRSFELGSRFFASAAFLIFYFFGGLAAFPLTEPDEGRYAGIALSMAHSGDYLTPRLNGIDYYEKPPLYFWSAALSTNLAGFAPWAARIPSALAGVGVTLLVGLEAARRRGSRAGVLAALCLLCMPLFALISRVAMVDTVLTFFTTAAVLAVARTTEGDGRRIWIHLAFAAAAGATLTKGPLGFAIPASGLIIYILIRRDWRLFKQFAWSTGPVLFLCITIPWFMLMERAHPGYLRDFLGGQIFGRFTHAEEFGRKEPFWYYAAPLLLGSFPAGFLFIRKTLLQDVRNHPYPACAAICPVLLLTASSGKLAYYILPVLPVAAIAAGCLLARDEAMGVHHPRSLASIGALLLVPAATGAILFTTELSGIHLLGSTTKADQAIDDWLLNPLNSRTAVVAAFVALAATGLAFLAAAIHHGRNPGLRSFAYISIAASMASFPFLACGFAGFYSVADVSEFVASEAGTGEPVVMFFEFLRTVPANLGRPVVLMDAPFSEFGHDVTPVEAGAFCMFRSRTLLKDRLCE